MQEIIAQNALLGGILIFFLRLCDMSMDTMRVLFVVRGKRLIVWVLGTLQSIIFIFAISGVLKGDINLYTVLGYATGYATGNVVGMLIEERLAIGFKKITIITKTSGDLIADALRLAGYGVTEIKGHGMDGDVAMIYTNVKRKHVQHVEEIAFNLDRQAFITVDEFSPVNRTGFWRK